MRKSNSQKREKQKKNCGRFLIEFYSLDNKNWIWETQAKKKMKNWTTDERMKKFFIFFVSILISLWCFEPHKNTKMKIGIGSVVVTLDMAVEIVENFLIS